MMYVAFVLALYAIAFGVGVWIAVGQRVPVPSRRSLAEIRQRAVRELMINDTITEYVVAVDGVVIEWGGLARRRVLLRPALNKVADSIALLTLGVEDFSRTLKVEQR